MWQSSRLSSYPISSILCLAGAASPPPRPPAPAQVGDCFVVPGFDTYPNYDIVVDLRTGADPLPIGTLEYVASQCLQEESCVAFSLLGDQGALYSGTSPALLLPGYCLYVRAGAPAPTLPDCNFAVVPFDWCPPGYNYRFLDCDGDGALDITCEGEGQRGVVFASTVRARAGQRLGCSGVTCAAHL